MSRRNGFLLAGLVVALLLAGVVSGFASSDPDGLERVVLRGLGEARVLGHALGDGPLADYGVRGVEDERLSTGLAGVLGVGITFAFGLGLFALVRRGRDEPSRPEDVGVPTP
ncbi:MAG TPA: PDGLE domain-containing protein [Mycobacteriales bacterium]|nr:PDGLE domain-containing protein [Mycobacteriales bacterium]